MGIVNDNGQLLRRMRIKKGLTQPALGALLDPPLTKQQIYKLETGKHRITATLAAQLSPILGVPPADLADEAFIVAPRGGKRSVVPVHGMVVLGVAQAGSWVESELHSYGYDQDTGESDRPAIPMVPIEDYPPELQYAIGIDGTSLNKILQPGDFAICVRLDGYPTDPELRALDGKLVHVERHRADLFETTIKRFRFNGGAPQLMPESDDPKHQGPVPLKDTAAKTTVQIVGVVIGRFGRL